MITGIVFTALGLSGTIMNMVIDSIINPERVQPRGDGVEKYFDEDIAMFVPALLRKLAVIQMVFGLLTILFCFKNNSNNLNKS